MKKIYLLFFIITHCLIFELHAQQNVIPKNTWDFVPWTTNTFPNLTLGTSDWASNNGNALLNNSNTVVGSVSNLLLDFADSLRINGNAMYSAGNIVGFRGSVQALTTDITIEISTWNGTQRVETKVYNNDFLSDLLGSVGDYTIETTLPYNSVQIKISTSLVAGFAVQYAIVKAFDSGIPLDCNSPSLINNNSHPFIVDESLTGKIGETAVNDFKNILNPSNSINFTFTPIVAGGVQLGLRDKINVYNDPYFIGFDLSSNTLLDVSALGTMEIRTYLNGAPKETISMSSASAGATLLGNNKQRIGFVTSEPFNTIQFYQNGISIGLSAITLNNLVITKFCAAEDLDCNETTNLKNPDHSVYINSIRTGLSGTGCVNCSISDAINILDDDPTTFASMNMVVSAGSFLALSVKDAMRTYPAGTYAGFDISKTSIIDLSVLGGIRIETYLNNQPVEEFTGSSLLGLGTSLIGGTTTSKIGFLSTGEFDEMRLVLIGSVGANAGSTKVYNAFVTKMCDVNTLDCNSAKTLSFPEYPVLINSLNTNISAGACVGCSLNNVNDIIDGNINTKASISLTGGFLTTAKVSVMKAVTPFEANTFIGLPIEMNSIANLDLNNNMLLIAYLEGVEVARADASTSSLVSLSSGGLFPTDQQTLGIVPNVSFDEIVFQITIPASVNAGTIDLYDLVVQKFCNQTLYCDSTYYLNQGTNGMPVYINYGGTGSSGVACAGCTVTDADAVISTEITDFAVLNVAAGVGASTSLSVKEAMNIYPFGTYVGFTIEAPFGLAQAQLFSGLTLQTFLKGEPQESRTSISLLDVSLLGAPIFAPGLGIYNVGFKVTKDFDEVRIISSEMAGVGVLDGVKVFGAWVDTRESNGGNLYCHKQVNPDMHAALINMQINGKLGTNDIMPSNAIYGQLVPHEENPAVATITSNDQGDYSFLTSTAGEYIYFYNVCVGTELCYPTFVKITATTEDIAPGTKFNVIVNPDYANVLSGSNATVKVLANDAPGNDLLSLDPTTLRISTIGQEGGKYGTVVINPDATITYTPNPIFIGFDSVRYFIKDNNTPIPNESSAWVVFSVYPSDYINTVVANNDFKATKYAISGSLLDNDQDPEGNNVSILNSSGGRVANMKNKKAPAVSARTVVSPEGTLEVEDDGTYTFTPAPGFKGTYQYVYQVVDNNEVSAENAATLTILVSDSYILPIHIESFDVLRNNGINVLNWKTSLEDKASHFVIERSIDGQNFNEIGIVKAENLREYKYEDKFVVSGKIYYRLKLVDIDNSFKYSSIKVIEGENLFKLSIYPNPAIDSKTYLNTGSYNGQILIILTDASGKKVSQSQMSVQSNATVSLPLLPSQKGVYYIIILDNKGNRLYQQKVINH